MPGIKTSSLKDIQLQPQEDGGGSKTEYADIFSSDDGTPSPIVLGVFTLENSDKPLLFDYTFDEGKYVIEGEVALTDLDSGETRNLAAGDVIHISSGTRTKWTTESRVKVLYVAGRGYDLADDIARMRQASESHAPVRSRARASWVGDLGESEHAERRSGSDRTLRRVLVTGGAGDIGAAIARRFTNDGASVTVVDRRIADRHREEGIRALVGDITDPEAMAAAVSTAGDGVGIDVCVANAGLLLIEDFVSGDVEGWRRIVDVNVIGTMVTVREAARAMIASGRGGRIVVVASNAGLRGEAGAAVYSATKGALVALMQGLAVELAGVGIRVNAVAPGEVDAGMNTAAMAKLAEIAQVPEDGFRSQVIERIPARRMASAQDVAAAVAFLASADAAHVTGLALPVDGGQLLV